MLPLSASVPLLALAAVVGAAPAPAQVQAGSVHHLPLVGRSTQAGRALTGQDLIDARLAEVDALGLKYGLEPSLPERQRRAKRATNSTVELGGNSLLYYASISVGTPPVSYVVTLDTGSADLVLATQESQTCSPGNQAYCDITASYYSTNLSSSATSTGQPVSLTYGTARASGTVVSDLISFGGFQERGNLAACPNVYHLTTHPDQTGLWGLGFKTLSASGSTPFLQDLYQKGELSSPEFGFGFSDLSTVGTDASTVVPGGTMTVGGTNSSLYTGEINWVSVTQGSRYWAVALDQVSVGGTALGITTPSAVIDTGSNLIAMPSDIASRIYAAIPNSRYYQSVYLYPCSANVNLAFTFGGVSYTLTRSNFNRGQYSTTECIGAILPLSVSSSSSSALTIIGTSFLMGVYNSYRFSPAAVGFATLATSAQNVFAQGALPTSNGTNTSPLPAQTSGFSGGGSSGGSTSSAAERGVALQGAVALVVGAAMFGALWWR